MKTRVIAACIALIAFAIAGVAVRFWQGADESAYKACRLSWQDRIQSVLYIDDLKYIPIDEKWREMSAAEIDRVVARINEFGRPDCPSRFQINFGDSGESTRVFVRRANNAKEVKLSD